MASHFAAQDVLTVPIELGHRAHYKERPSSDGFTHDWTVFVRGVDGAGMGDIVEKVVFHLHKTFKNPKRGNDLYLYDGRFLTPKTHFYDNYALCFQHRKPLVHVHRSGECFL